MQTQQIALAFIANTVAAYKDQIYKDRTDKVVAWE
jgi:hypothetical protein